ncbi:hypothetical protein UFOVP539_23 [uncultured Caudovirales phage]|uniref:Uncharacterized protein n=1 Tax=uncultured Caudovirales phage TaxID=2100421 RepID=A0A6J5MQ72_9CAUD|nr:hypothetical protein UFOVP539_23 [uncultured Caudovirales phage]
MSNVVIRIASEFVGAPAFKKAASSTDKLTKSVKSLGRAFGVGLSVAAVSAFGKATVRAFAEDEAAAAKLAKVVDNLGIGFANVEIAKFIGDLETTSGVLDDSLRPAFQALLTTTGSLEASQKSLSQAIDISRGSGFDLVTVANDLGKAYIGNTRGLVKYNLGLSKAELATMSFAEIQAKLNEQFTGSNAAYLETYAGKLSVLKVAADNAKEAIGKGIVDALGTLAGDTSITELANKISSIATGIADFIRGFAIGLRDLAQMPIIKQLLQIIKFIGEKVYNATGKVFVDAGAAQRLQQEKLQRKQDLLTEKEKAAALAKMEAAAKKRAQDLAKATKKATDEQKKADALKKAGNIFDMDQIQVIAALKGKVTDEERKRLELQLAILTGNSVEASKLSGEIAKSQGLTEKLTAYLSDLPKASNPFSSWAQYLDAIEAQAKRVATLSMGGGSSTSTSSPVIPSYNGGAIDAVLGSYGSGATSVRADASGNVNVYIGGSVVSEGDLVEAVANGLLNRSLSGSPSAIGRLKGSFAG